MTGLIPEIKNTSAHIHFCGKIQHYNDRHISVSYIADDSVGIIRVYVKYIYLGSTKTF